MTITVTGLNCLLWADALIVVKDEVGTLLRLDMTLLQSQTQLVFFNDIGLQHQTVPLVASSCIYTSVLCSSFKLADFV